MNELSITEPPADSYDETRRGASCVVCGRSTFRDPDYFPICPECNSKYPAALVKASCDPFDYALGLKHGEIIRFSEASIDGDWVHLNVDRIYDDEEPNPIKRLTGLCFARGIDVRISEIAWVADAPEGS